MPTSCFCLYTWFWLPFICLLANLTSSLALWPLTDCQSRCWLSWIHFPSSSLEFIPIRQFSALQHTCPFMFYISLKYSATCFHFSTCFTYAPGHCTAQLCTTFACYSYHLSWLSSIPYFIPYYTCEQPWKMEAGSSSKSSLNIVSKKTTFHCKKLNFSWCFCFFTALWQNPFFITIYLSLHIYLCRLILKLMPSQKRDTNMVHFTLFMNISWFPC